VSALVKERFLGLKVLLVFLLLLGAMALGDSDLGGFADEDKDGVPDDFDECSGSKLKLVDEKGCDCEQKCVGNCGVGTLGPVCLELCEDGVQNGDEKGIDCGGSCPVCLEEKESENCNEDECPKGFTCQEDGKCVMMVPQQGKKCKTQNVFYSLEKVDCKAKGADWVEEKKDKFVKIEASSYFFEGYIDDFVQEELGKATICVKTEDLGCVSSAIRCFGENQLTQENKDKAAEILKQEIDSQIELPWYVDWFMDVEVKVDLSEFKIDQTYDCPEMKLDALDACKELVKNGDFDEKADLLFIGDGFAGEGLKEEVLSLIDYYGEQTGTKKEGFFSEEPFKSDKEKFNVWYLGVEEGIDYKMDSYNPSWGMMPAFKSVVGRSNYCPWFDYIVVLSKNKDYRANCMMGKPGPCRVSLKGQQYPGRLLIHELGHGFGSLTDEYYNYVEKKEDPTGFSKFFSEFQVGPNCKKTEEEADASWGTLVGGMVGHFKGCGGDCGLECGEFIRPTVNSVMKSQTKKCNSETSCASGPPYDTFYAVNEKEILDELGKYS
jgi:hypothetical protein